MPLSTVIALFAIALAFFAAGSPFGGVFLMLGAIALSLKIGMPVISERRRERISSPARPGHRRA